MRCWVWALALSALLQVRAKSGYPDWYPSDFRPQDYYGRRNGADFRPGVERPQRVEDGQESTDRGPKAGDRKWSGFPERLFEKSRGWPLDDSVTGPPRSRPPQSAELHRPDPPPLGPYEQIKGHRANAEHGWRFDGEASAEARPHRGPPPNFNDRLNNRSKSSEGHRKSSGEGPNDAEGHGDKSKSVERPKSVEGSEKFNRNSSGKRPESGEALKSMEHRNWPRFDSRESRETRPTTRSSEVRPNFEARGPPGRPSSRNRSTSTEDRRRPYSKRPTPTNPNQTTTRGRTGSSHFGPPSLPGDRPRPTLAGPPSQAPANLRRSSESAESDRNVALEQKFRGPVGAGRGLGGHGSEEKLAAETLVEMGRGPDEQRVGEGKNEVRDREREERKSGESEKRNDKSADSHSAERPSSTTSSGQNRYATPAPSARTTSYLISSTVKPYSTPSTPGQAYAVTSFAPNTTVTPLATADRLSSRPTWKLSVVSTTLATIYPTRYSRLSSDLPLPSVKNSGYTA